jgi:dTDP-4-dehydrorhamnose reductase
MILLLGATSYVGQGFARTLRRRKDSFIPLSRNAFDYTRFEFLFDYVRKVKPDLVINAAECTEKPNGDAGGGDRTEMLKINTLLPQTIARVCSLTNTSFGHVSSGSIYSGAKIAENGGFTVLEDLWTPSVRGVLDSNPKRIFGFSEHDKPNSSFNSAPCTFYSGTKALAEEALRGKQLYIWRLSLPFNEVDDPSNFLSQLQDGLKVHDAINSISHLDECVAACLELWERQVPFGIFNVVNPGPVRIHHVTQLIQRILKPARQFQLMIYDNEGAAIDQRFPHGDCVLDNSKIMSAGVKLRWAEQAIEDALGKWTPQGVSTVNNNLA